MSPVPSSTADYIRKTNNTFYLGEPTAEGGPIAVGVLDADETDVTFTFDRRNFDTSDYSLDWNNITRVYEPKTAFKSVLMGYQVRVQIGNPHVADSSVLASELAGAKAIPIEVPYSVTITPLFDAAAVRTHLTKLPWKTAHTATEFDNAVAIIRNLLVQFNCTSQLEYVSAVAFPKQQTSSLDEIVTLVAALKAANSSNEVQYAWNASFASGTPLQLAGRTAPIGIAGHRPAFGFLRGFIHESKPEASLYMELAMVLTPRYREAGVTRWGFSNCYGHTELFNDKVLNPLHSGMIPSFIPTGTNLGITAWAWDEATPQFSDGMDAFHVSTNSVPFPSECRSGMHKADNAQEFLRMLLAPNAFTLKLLIPTPTNKNPGIGSFGSPKLRTYLNRDIRPATEGRIHKRYENKDYRDMEGKKPLIVTYDAAGKVIMTAGTPSAGEMADLLAHNAAIENKAAGNPSKTLAVGTLDTKELPAGVTGFFMTGQQVRTGTDAKVQQIGGAYYGGRLIYAKIDTSTFSAASPPSSLPVYFFDAQGNQLSELGSVRVGITVQ